MPFLILHAPSTMHLILVRGPIMHKHESVNRGFSLKVYLTPNVLCKHPKPFQAEAGFAHSSRVVFQNGFGQEKSLIMGPAKESKLVPFFKAGIELKAGSGSRLLGTLF